jgi:hypothetical protein
MIYANGGVILIIITIIAIVMTQITTFPEGGDDVCGCRINLYFRLLFTSIFTLAGRHGSLQPYITETSITRTIQMGGVEKVLQPASAIFHRSN